jgi:hypothetical protein
MVGLSDFKELSACIPYKCCAYHFDSSLLPENRNKIVHGTCGSACCWRLGEWDRATNRLQVAAGDDVGWVFLIK